jgi:hypothetical protein
MTTLDDRLLRDLARLREGAGPPRGAEDRVLAALQNTFGGDPGGGDPSGSDGSGLGDAGLGDAGLGSTGLGKLAFGAKVIAATTAFTGAGLLVIKLGAIAIHPTPPPERAVEIITPAASTDAPPSSTGGEPEPGIATDLAILVTPRAVEVQKPAKVEADPLAAELALFEQARATSDLAVRLELLERHREGFASGVLGAERDALRISTLCELDEMEAAREAAEQFLILHPRSPLRLRMRRACPKLDILAE